MRHSNSIQNSFSLSRNNVFLYTSRLYQYFVCTKSDCTDNDIQCTKTGCTEKNVPKVCNEIVLYRKRPTPRELFPRPGCVTLLMSTEHCTSSIFANSELNFDSIDNYSDVDKFH